MRKWITLPQTQGISSRQAHTNLPNNSYERELGKHGFNGPSTHMYHQHPPTNWAEITGTLTHHAFDTNLITQSSNSPWEAVSILSNAYLNLRIWKCRQSMEHLVRNADGDELLFVHHGQADLYCDYGHLQINQGDYIMIPKGTLWRIDINKDISIILIEATQQSYQIPDKGIVGQHAIFDQAVLDIPIIDEKFKAQQNDNNCSVLIKRLNQISAMRYSFNPLDAIGWHGTLMPVRINWRDIRPIMSHRYHIPPSAHTTFETENFIISTFVPRPIESDPDALKVPFYHSNDDYDEVIFYHRGTFFSRDNIEQGMITLHPSGIPHGPHPNAYKQGKEHSRKETDEVALMIDSRYPLEFSDNARTIENVDYVNSWK
ncbi:Homogentisate 1,2-dioxygenase [hydrothermal vent metagenome]|uniref:Homogentisate 1,2-dioxygenase n=1 Tax=hydrothermal vent metagenome TaxID=652676 RepID=A0A3B1AFZ9_9ZZZZ